MDNEHYINIASCYDEGLVAAAMTTPEQMLESEMAQHHFKIVYAAERTLAASVPKLVDIALRWTIAREVAQYYRKHDTILEAVRRWYPDSWRDNLKREGKNNKLAINPMNAYLLLKYHPAVRGSIRFNLFTKQIEIKDGPLALRKAEDLDSIVTAAQDWIYSVEDVCINIQDLGRRVAAVAIENSFDPIRDYLTGLRWDGVSRIEANGGWLARYAGAHSDAANYISEVGKKFLVAAISRALDPGSKTDVVLLLLGTQGLKKSSLFEALGGNFYADAAIALGDKDSKMMASSSWILELPDMASFKRSEQNAMKAFLTTRIDKFRAPFGRGILPYPRRCVFCTTTNDEEIFQDATGNRRYLPAKCYGQDDRDGNAKTDIAGLIRDRDQLWAEAVAIYMAADSCVNCDASTDMVWGQRPRCDKHSWWLSRAMERVAEGETKIYEDHDVWTAAVLAWAENPVDDVTGLKREEKKLDITTVNCLVYGIGKPLGQCTQWDKIRVGKILGMNGYESGKPHRGLRIYEKTDPNKKKINIALVPPLKK